MLYGVQYVSNKNGQITAVQVSIEEWEFIKSKSPDIELNLSLPVWQTETIGKRLACRVLFYSYLGCNLYIS